MQLQHCLTPRHCWARSGARPWRVWQAALLNWAWLLHQRRHTHASLTGGGQGGCQGYLLDKPQMTWHTSTAGFVAYFATMSNSMICTRHDLLQFPLLTCLLLHNHQYLMNKQESHVLLQAGAPSHVCSCLCTLFSVLPAMCCSSCARLPHRSWTRRCCPVLSSWCVPALWPSWQWCWVRARRHRCRCRWESRLPHPSCEPVALL